MEFMELIIAIIIALCLGWGFFKFFVGLMKVLAGLSLMLLGRILRIFAVVYGWSEDLWHSPLTTQLFKKFQTTVSQETRHAFDQESR